MLSFSLFDSEDSRVGGIVLSCFCFYKDFMMIQILKFTMYVFRVMHSKTMILTHGANPYGQLNLVQ